MAVLTILGSARHDGATGALVETVLGGRAATRIDLRVLNIQHYEYGLAMERDDFAQVAAAMLSHDVIVFATPVYWYAMSGRMKVLFDRFTDLMTVRKDLGRRLHGRTVFLIACGSDPELPDGFEVPFRETAAYFDLHYGGALYAQITKESEIPPAELDRAAAFGDRIFASRQP